MLFVLSNAANQARIAGSATAADAMIVYAGAVNALGEAQDLLAAKPGATASLAEVVRTAIDGSGIEAARLTPPGSAPTVPLVGTAAGA